MTTKTAATAEVRERLADVLTPRDLEAVMDVLGEYQVTRRRGAGVLNIVMQGLSGPAGGRAFGGFGPGALQEAFTLGRRFPRWPR